MFVCALLAAATLLSYWPVIHQGFINLDDPTYVTLNRHVRTGLSWQNVSWSLSSGYASNWHPLTWVSHMMDAQFFQLRPGWHHLTNLIFHSLNTALLFVLLQKLTACTRRSAIVAGLFSLHPLRVESVAWIAERKDVLSGFFFLLTVLAYARYAEDRKLGVDGIKRRSAIWYAIALILFALGLMSKPMLVTVPFVLLLLDFWPLKRLRLDTFQLKPAVPLLIEKVPFLLMSIGSSVVTFAVQHKGGAVSTTTGLPITGRLANALHAYAAYLGKTFWPTKLCIFYPHPGYQLSLPTITDDVAVAGAAVLVIGLSIASILLRNRAPHLFTGWFWFVGMLIPVIGIVQVGGQAYADRYTYLPSIGIFICCVWVVAEVAQARIPGALLAAAGTALVIVCAFLTRHQLSYWRTNFAVFQHALDVTKNNALAYYNVGVEYGVQGKDDIAKGHFEAAMKADPQFIAPVYSMGFMLMLEGHAAEAEEKFHDALRLKPNYAMAYNKLGVLAWQQGKAEEAWENTQKALSLDPDLAESHENLARLMTARGDLSGAVAEFNESLRLEPGNTRVMTELAEIVVRQGNVAKGEALLREVVRRESGSAESRVHLGEVLAVEGKRAEAIQEYTAALRMKPDWGQVHCKMGTALLQNGEAKQSEAEFREALKLEPGSGEATTGLGRALGAQGKMSEAAQQFEAAVKLSPTNAESQVELAVALLMTGNTNEAQVHFSKAATLDPDLAQRNVQIGKALASQGQIDAAAGRFLTASFLSPNDAESRRELGLLLAQQGKFGEAETQFEQAARLKPDADTFRNLGLAQLLQGRAKEAVASYRRAMELKPDWPVILNDLAWLLATNPDSTIRNGGEAVQLAQKANDLAGGKEARYLGTLDAALAETGRFDEAIATAEKARALALVAGEKDLASAAQERCDLYKNKQPFRTK